jgi:hypothetical protein
LQDFLVEDFRSSFDGVRSPDQVISVFNHGVLTSDRTCSSNGDFASSMSEIYA